MQAYFDKQLERRPSDKFYMVFSTILVFLITIFVTTRLVSGQEMWINHPGYPGGASAYFIANMSAWYLTMSAVASTLLQLMTDGLLVSVLSSSSRKECTDTKSDSAMFHGLASKLQRAFRPLLHLVIVSRFVSPLLLLQLLSQSTVLGILNLITSASPKNNFYEGLKAHVGLVYICLTIGLNVLVTCLICGRIIFCARRMQHHFGHEASRDYFTIVAIVVESAVPFTLFGIAFLVSFGLVSYSSIIFLSLYGMFTVSGDGFRVQSSVANLFLVYFPSNADSSRCEAKGVDCRGSTVNGSGFRYSVDYSPFYHIH